MARQVVNCLGIVIFSVCFSYSVSPITASRISCHFGKLFGLLKFNNCCHLTMMGAHMAVL